jgi:hypothetical protein
MSTLRTSLIFVYSRSMRNMPGMMVKSGTHMKYHCCSGDVRLNWTMTPGGAFSAGPSKVCRDASNISDASIVSDALKDQTKTHQFVSN